MRYGELSTDKSIAATRADIRETMRKWGKGDYEVLVGNVEAQIIIHHANGRAPETFSCRRFHYPEVNLRALYLALEALRLADQRGILEQVASMATAFLPPPSTAPVKRPWYEVLGVMPDADDEVVQASYRVLAKKRHPDAGGSEEAMVELNVALEEAQAR